MAPLPPHEARKHKIFLLALFSSLVLSSGLFTYFMLLPFSQFAAASPRANKPDEHHESSIKDHVGALGSSSRVADLAEHDDAYANLSHEHDALWHHRDLLSTQQQQQRRRRLPRNRLGADARRQAWHGRVPAAFPRHDEKF